MIRFKGLLVSHHVNSGMDHLLAYEFNIHVVRLKKIIADLRQLFVIGLWQVKDQAHKCSLTVFQQNVVVFFSNRISVEC